MSTGTPGFKANRDQLTAIATAFTRHGIKDRTDRLRLCSDHAGRLLHSSSQLTHAEAEALIRRLSSPRLYLRARLAQLIAAEEDRAREWASRKTDAPEDGTPLPAGAIACGPEPPTEHDRQAIAAFAEFLTTAGPPPDPIDRAVAVLRDAGLISEEPS